MEQENAIRQENPRTGVHVLISLSVYIGLYFFLSMVLSVAAYLGLGLSGGYMDRIHCPNTQLFRQPVCWPVSFLLCLFLSIAIIVRFLI